eukprot:COSAG02_NODE_518_length_20798_cov_12.622301_3_plen_391_part_00
MRLSRQIGINWFAAVVSACVGQQYPEWLGPGAAAAPRANDELALSHHSAHLSPSAVVVEATRAALSASDIPARLNAASRAILRAEPPRSNGENRLVSAPSPGDFGSHCRAILLTGDSNLRNVFHLLAQSFEEAGHMRRYRYPTEDQAALPCNTNDPTVECRPQWADQTWIYTALPVSGRDEPATCTVALMFRFMNNQAALRRASVDPFDTLLCNARSLGKQSPVCRDARRLQLDPVALKMLRAAKVVVAWHAHGLWGFDSPPWSSIVTGVTDGSSFDCPSRFSDDIISMRQLESAGIPVVWQSNFPIASHPTVTNEFLQKDVECQRQQAAQYGLTMIDMPALGLAAGTVVVDGPATWTASKQAGGWHLNAHGSRAIVAAVVEAVKMFDLS